MNYIFNSDRLGFRNWTKADVEPFAKLNQDDEVMTFFPNKLTKAETATMVERLQSIFDENGYTFFAVDELNSKEFLGFIGIINTSFESFFTPCVEIGWRLKKEVWNRGYATEGAKACLNYAFNELNIPEIYSFTAQTNVKSQRIMQKIGMNEVGAFDHPRLDEDDPLCHHVLYKIEK